MLIMHNMMFLKHMHKLCDGSISLIITNIAPHTYFFNGENS